MKTNFILSIISKDTHPILLTSTQYASYLLSYIEPAICLQFNSITRHRPVRSAPMPYIPHRTLIYPSFLFLSPPRRLLLYQSGESIPLSSAIWYTDALTSYNQSLYSSSAHTHSNKFDIINSLKRATFICCFRLMFPNAASTRSAPQQIQYILHRFPSTVVAGHKHQNSISSMDCFPLGYELKMFLTTNWTLFFFC